MEKVPNESVEEFSDRVRETLAATLNVKLSDYSYEDKEKYVKQIEAEAKQSNIDIVIIIYIKWNNNIHKY
jgi:hypothetical protein